MTDIGCESYRIPDALWQQIELLLPPEIPRLKGGRPRMNSRKAMEAILYMLYSGCKWKAIPRKLGAPSTIRRRFQEWQELGVFQRMWRAGILDYDELRTLVWYGKRKGQAVERLD